MTKNLLDISTEELLEKFGKGKHVPGSGSAAAFQGMISSKLLVTVISLTCDIKRNKSYSIVVPELLNMLEKIQERIFPELTKLFYNDSYHFDRAIKLRTERDKAKDHAIATNLERQAQKELKIAIDIPLEIAALNIELAEMASYIFDNGWKAVRGDSQVALNGAISAMAGCISIINLNLLTFGGDQYEYIVEIGKKVDILKKIYYELHENANSKIENLEAELKVRIPLYKGVTEILSKVKSKPYLSDVEIESCAIKLQQLIYEHRDFIWKEDNSASPLSMLNPALALQKVLGYRYYLMDEIILSDQEDYTNVAGIIDQRDKLILISKQYIIQTQNFTTAHELGHAMLHSELVMHRDKPLDVSNQTSIRSKEEIQADKFAAYFLMPKKQIIKEFINRFQTDKFLINELTAFNLIKAGPDKLKSEVKDIRGLARKLADSERYENHSFEAMTKIFNVSTEAMAIRFQEISLIEI